LKQAAIEAGQAAASRSSTITAVGDPPVISGPDGTVNGEILVKHVLTKELQMYYEKITDSVLSSSRELSNLAVESVSKDPGIQPLLPYFTQFITEKVTKNVRNLQILWAMIRMTRAILDNKNLFVEPYVGSYHKCTFQIAYLLL
jgi:transcription initiation factor TFIID subunit 6